MATFLLERPGRLGIALSLVLFVGAMGCKRSEEAGGRVDEGTRDPVTGLTPAESAEVLAHVGDRSITLGEYAASLARMDRFERLRYQSEERQKELLDEMIEVELLAQEARRRGLHEDPEVRQRVQQALRDEVLEDLRQKLPKAEELSEREVRAYYEEHRGEFKEPLRHRVMVIVLGNPELAKKVIEEATGASGEKWGKLARTYSQERRGLGSEDALELAGDLGFVSAPGQERGKNAEVPESVREAVFTLDRVGDVAAEPAMSGKHYYVVRLGGISPARDRSLRDADRTIRSELLRQKFLDAEKKLEVELRKRYPVVIDEKAIEARAQALKSESPQGDTSPAFEEKQPTP